MLYIIYIQIYIYIYTYTQTHICYILSFFCLAFELLPSSKTLSAKSICFYGLAYSVFTHIYTCIYTSGLSKIYF